MLEVREETAIAAPGASAALEEAARQRPGAVVYPVDSAGEPPAAWRPPAVSTLRELEEACPPVDGGIVPLGAPAAAWAARFAPDRAGGGVSVAALGFRVVRLPASFGVREEILARIPRTARRLLDVGCGAGETAAAARARFGLRAEGIERDPLLAEAARSRLDAVHAGDAPDVLQALRARGERFDVLVFADVLEHLREPAAALESARGLAGRGAAIVVSVPNAGCAPIVADLLAGRFDPVAAGPEDAGHLRWFTRSGLRALLEESGLEATAVDSVAVPGDGGLAARLSAAGVRFDPRDLGAIQWIATARA